MRDYEVVYIFKSALGTEDIDARLERYHAKILSAEGSEITAVEHWGKRQLAYPIDRNENGYYVVAQFSTEPGALPEFERLLKLDDEVLRHLVVLSEGELAVPVSLGDDDEDDNRRRKGRDDDDDEPRRGRDDAVREAAAAAATDAADATDAAADEVDAADDDDVDADADDGSDAESDEDTDEEDKD